MKKGYKKEEGEAEINLKSPTFKKKFGGIYHIFKEESIKTSAFQATKIGRKVVFSLALVFL
jgi:hypothetical protein